MRKLVTRREITDVSPIPGADFIERVTIGGWHCVAKKGEFSVEDNCIYFLNSSPLMTCCHSLMVRVLTIQYVKDLSGKERMDNSRLRQSVTNSW